MTDGSDRRLRLEQLRERAAALLQGGAEAVIDDTDVKQLLHELRVLNTELAMQHDELLVSERRAQAQALAWEQLFRESPVAILTIDGQRRLERYNDEAAVLLNLAPRYLSEPIDWLIDGASQARWHEVLADAGARPLMQELVARTVGGGRVAVRAMVTRKAGAHEAGWLLVLLDVSALAAASARAVEATTRLERLVGSMSDGVLFARWSTGLVEHLNPAMATLLGVAADGPPTMTLTSLFAPHRVGVALVVLQSLAREARREPVSMQLRTADGRLVDVEVLASFLEEAQGPVLAMVARDVSEKVALARRRAEVEAAALRSQKLEAVGQLAVGIAHDFNNLLTVIVNCHAGLVPSFPADEPHLADLQRAALRGRELTGRLLTLSRLKAERHAPMRLSTVCREALELARRSFPPSIVLETDFATERDEVDGDEGQWVQALLNVFINARDAMPAGGQLRVTLADAGGGVTLAVRDTGVGMAPDVARKAFEPFFTTKGVGAGTGLGLAHVQALATAHQVRLTLESRPGEGTTVRFHVPAARLPTAVGAAAAPVEREVAGLVVLVVDDDEPVRRSVVRTLRRLKCEPLEAEGPEPALEVLRARPAIDVVLTDLSMPGLTGEDLLRLVGELPTPVPVVVVTGLATDETERRLREGGAVAVLTKPYTTEELRAALASALGPGPSAPRAG
jgi:PAS domain S-box-containing protein